MWVMPFLPCTNLTERFNIGSMHLVQHLLTNVLYGPFKALEATSVTMALACLCVVCA